MTHEKVARENRPPDPTHPLASLVSFAYAIYQGVVPLPEPAPAEPEPAGRDRCGRCSETYVDGLVQEIEQRYSFPKNGFAALRDKALSGVLGPFSEEDCVEAVKVLDEFLVSGLFAESRYGDTREAVEELEKRVPGLDRRMYSQYIGMLGYVNR